MIIEILIRLTRKENRIPFDNMCNKCEEQVYNPGLITEIIDKIFAEAKANNQKKLTKENLIYGIKSCNKIDDKAKIDFIVEINDYFIEEPEPVHKPNFIAQMRIFFFIFLCQIRKCVYICTEIKIWTAQKYKKARIWRKKS